MMDFSKYIREVQKKLDLSDPSELADRLSVSPQVVEDIIHGTAIPEEELCLKIAYLVGEDPSTVLVIAKYTNAPPTTKSFWEKVLLKLRDGRVYQTGVKDRRSWKDRRGGALGPSSKGGKVPSNERRKTKDRRSWIDRRFPG